MIPAASAAGSVATIAFTGTSVHLVLADSMRRSVTGDSHSASLINYRPTEPLLVVEVDADVCFEHDRWPHPTQLCWVRLDLYTDEISGVEAR